MTPPEHNPSESGRFDRTLSGPDLGAQLRAALADRLPPVVRGGLVAPGRKATVGLLIVVLAGAVFAVYLATHSGTREAVAADQPLPAEDGEDAPASASAAAAPAPRTVAASPASATGLLVDVAGRVHHPGVVSLPAGSRVDDALTAAGGALPGVDLTPLDLASRVVDGEQVRVGLPGSAVTAGQSTNDGQGSAGTSEAVASPDVAASSPAQLVDLNAATETELDALPGVGPVTAQRIVAWRTSHGRFTSTSQLTQIQGLGGAKGKKLLTMVTAG